MGGKSPIPNEPEKIPQKPEFVGPIAKTVGMHPGPSVNHIILYAAKAVIGKPGSSK